MAQFGERLALAAGLVLRNGKVVMSAMSSPKKSDGLASGSPNAPPSQGPEIVADELTSGLPNAPLSPGQADFGAGGQAISPARVLLRRMRTAFGGGRPADSVEPSSLKFQDDTPVRPRRPEPARKSAADLQADATGMKQILQELHRMMQEVRA